MRAVGLNETVGVPTAVPVNGTELSATLTLAVRVPVAVGLKVTLMEQVALTARVATQVVVREKSPGAAPARETLMPVRGAVPLFARVMICAAPEEPMEVLAKVSEMGLSETVGAPTLRATAAEELGPKLRSPG